MKGIKNILIMVVFFLSFISSSIAIDEVVYQKDSSVQLYQVCDSCTYVNIENIIYPSGNIEYLNSTMTKNGYSYNYSFTNTSELGQYFYFVCGDKEGELTCETLSFIVTNSGYYDESSGEKWIIIGILLIFMTALFGFITLIIKDETLYPIKMLFFILTVTNTLVLGILAYIISINPFDVMSYNNIGLGYAGINITVLVGFLWNYYFAGFGKIYKRSTRKMVNKRDDFNNEKFIK